MSDLAIILFLGALVVSQIIAWAWAIGEVNRMVDIRWQDSRDLRQALAKIERLEAEIDKLETRLELHGIRPRI